MKSNKKFIFMYLFFFFILFIKNIKSQESKEMLTGIQMRKSGKEEAFGVGLYGGDGSKKFRFFSTGQLAIVGFYDSHQFIGAFFDGVVYYPRRQNIDSSGLDISQKDIFSMYAINIGLKTLFVGPDLWGAKVVGRFEFGFGGLNDKTLRNMVIGASYISFIWPNSEVKAGFYFHPVALSSVYPTPVTGDEGLGFDPTRRVPLVSFNHTINRFKFSLVVSKIAAKPFATTFAQWENMPDLCVKLKVNIAKNYHFGIGLNSHVEMPRLETENGYKTTEQVNGVVAFVFGRMLAYPFLIKLRANYLKNGSPFGVLGSYCVQYRNPVTDERIYTSMQVFTAWTDLVYVHSKFVEPGIFFGFSKGLGTTKNIVKSYTKIVDGKPEDVSLINIGAFVQHTKCLLRVAPRIRVRINKLILGFEVSYMRGEFARDPSQAGWQDDYDCRGRVVNSKPASNTRVIFNAVYAF